MIFGDVIKISTTQKVKLYKSIQHKMIYHYGISSSIKYVEVLYSDFLNNFQEYIKDNKTNNHADKAHSLQRSAVTLRTCPAQIYQRSKNNQQYDIFQQRHLLNLF